MFSRPSERHATQGSDPLEGTSGAGRPDAPPCLQEARTLQAAYGLTNRETDVAVLLLEGRSRPFIRDELVVSINTVSTHVRSIFAKCGVHSQQELMVLARNARSANED